jgi:hypothetical protein
VNATLLQPYAEMPTGTAIRHALKWQVIGLVLLAYHVFLVRQSLAFVVAMPILLAVLYTNAPLAALLVYFQFLIYQNIVIALGAVGMPSMNFTVLSGTNFLAITLMAGIGAGRLFQPPWRAQTSGTMTAVIVAILLAGCYAALGVVRAGPTSAAIYFREFIGPVCAVVVGLDIGRTWGFRTITIGLLISVTLSFSTALLEMTIPYDYYSWINAVDFANLKSASLDGRVYSPLDVVAQNTTALFNTYWDSAEFATATSIRFGSSLVNPISYAYILALAGLAAVSLRQYLWLIVIVPLLIAAGVKGAAILFVFSVCLWTILNTTGNGRITLVSAIVLLTLYVVFGMAHGLESGDFHVIGFLGGWHGFLSNPLGHGLGVGGNLSAAAARMPDWTGTGGMQSAGADFGLESAVGVLIYQMGIGSLAIFAVFFRLLKAAPFLKRKPQGRDVWFLALLTVVVNGVFQEEAYAPTAAGLVAMLCAVTVMNERRQALLLSGHGVKLAAHPASSLRKPLDSMTSALNM